MRGRNSAYAIQHVHQPQILRAHEDSNLRAHFARRCLAQGFSGLHMSGGQAVTPVTVAGIAPAAQKNATIFHKQGIHRQNDFESVFWAHVIWV